jgi:hypothetical protein
VLITPVDMLNYPGAMPLSPQQMSASGYIEESVPMLKFPNVVQRPMSTLTTALAAAKDLDADANIDCS